MNKKLIAMLSALSLSVTVTACSKNENNFWLDSYIIKIDNDFFDLVFIIQKDNNF